MDQINAALEYYHAYSRTSNNETLVAYASLAEQALTRMKSTPVKHEKYFYGYIHLCPNCGNQVEDTTTFCQKCGQHLDWKAWEDALV